MVMDKKISMNKSPISLIFSLNAGTPCWEADGNSTKAGTTTWLFISPDIINYKTLPGTLMRDCYEPSSNDAISANPSTKILKSSYIKMPKDVWKLSCPI